MDPLSILGAVATVGEVISMVYKFSKTVAEAKRETAQLCSELFGLRATFEHMGKELEQTTADRKLGHGDDGALSTSMNSEESIVMLGSAVSIINELSRKLRKSSEGRLRRINWAISKSDIMEYVQKLERHRSYFNLVLTSDDFELSKRIYLELRSAKSLIEDQRDRQLQKDHLAQRSALKDWLAPYDPYHLYDKALSEHHPATGDWFLQEILPGWISTEADKGRSVLRLKGKPGTGKTTLMSRAIQDTLALRNESSDIGVAFCFSTLNEPGSTEPRNVIGTLIEQLGYLAVPGRQAIESRYRNQVPQVGGDRQPPSIDVLKDLLVECCQHFTHVYLYLDGVNESSDTIKLLTCMSDVVRLASNARVVVSSTESAGLQIPNWSSDNVYDIDMSLADINSDIGKYIESCLHENDRLRALPPRLKQDIKQKFVGNAEDSFQWVKCQLQSVLLGKTPREIRAALENVPHTLEQTYCNELMSVPQDQRYLVRRVLLWLTFSPRPMMLEELYEAIMVEEDTTTIDEDWRLLYPTETLKSCGKLISHRSDNRQVTLAHSSVRSYMTSTQLRESPASYFWIDPKTAHAMLMRYCLTYLCFEVFEDGFCDEVDTYHQRFAEWPLLRYSATTFPELARLISDFEKGIDAPTRDIVIKLLRSANRRHGGYFGSFIQAFLPYMLVNIDLSTTLYFAARENLNGVVKLLLAIDGTRDLEVRGGRRGSTPLHAASAFGHIEIVKTLLAAGADATEINRKDESGLQWAHLAGQSDVVKLLIEAGADPVLIRGPRLLNTIGLKNYADRVRNGPSEVTFSPSLEAAQSLRERDLYMETEIEQYLRDPDSSKATELSRTASDQRELSGSGRQYPLPADAGSDRFQRTNSFETTAGQYTILAPDVV